jgi:hypothetical protein
MRVARLRRDLRCPHLLGRRDRKDSDGIRSDIGDPALRSRIFRPRDNPCYTTSFVH